MDQAAADKVAVAVGFKIKDNNTVMFCQPSTADHWLSLWNHAVSLQSRLDKMEIALRFAKEVVDDQAERFHKGCRCQLCESAPMLINDALGIEGAEVVNWTDPPKEQK